MAERISIRVQLEIIFQATGDFHRHAAGQDHFCLVGDEAGGGDDHFVARIEQGIHHQVKRLRYPHCDEDFLNRIVLHVV